MNPEGVVSRILSRGAVSDRDLADLSLVCGRLEGDLSDLMPLLAGVIQKAVAVNILEDAKEIYGKGSPSESSLALDAVCVLLLSI